MKLVFYARQEAQAAPVVVKAFEYDYRDDDEELGAFFTVSDAIIRQQLIAKRVDALVAESAKFLPYLQPGKIVQIIDSVQSGAATIPIYTYSKRVDVKDVPFAITCMVATLEHVAVKSPVLHELFNVIATQAKYPDDILDFNVQKPEETGIAYPKL